MQEVNSFLSEQQARHLTVHGVARNEDGSYSWKFDNYVRTSAPYRFDENEMKELWGRITCPTLLVRGADSWASDPSIDGRMDAFKNVHFENFEGSRALGAPRSPGRFRGADPVVSRQKTEPSSSSLFA